MEKKYLYKCNVQPDYEEKNQCFFCVLELYLKAVITL